MKEQRERNTRRSCKERCPTSAQGNAKHAIEWVRFV